MIKYWKTITVSLSVIFLITLAGHAAAAENWGEVAKQINAEQEQAIEGAAETEQIVEKDRSTLEKELAQLKAQEAREERTLERLRSEFEGLRKQEEQLKEDLANEQEEIDAIEGTIRGTAKDASTLSRDNPTTAEYPERTGILDELINSKRFPGLDGIKILTEFFFQEMAEQGKIVRRSGELVGPDGRNTTGEIIRVGRFTTYYRLADGSVGFLVPDAVGERLIAITGEVPWGTQQSIKSYFDEETNITPIDPSAGGGFTKLTESEDLRDWLEKGGTLMYAILAVGIFAILLGLERIIVLGTKARASDTVMENIKALVSKGRWKDARAYCVDKSRVPTCQMLDSVMEHVGHTQIVLENALQEAILKQMPKLERFLTTLALLAAIAPLLGLLGTVTGMITTFKVITEVGTGDPTMMAGGISEALLTTQFGLMTAVPIMLLHHFLERQVDKIVNDMQEKGTAFAVTLVKQNGVSEG
jgi:biopolymer transport protein ExbB